MQKIIRKGENTDHGGVGQQVSCLRRKGVLPIVEGSPVYKVDGTLVELHGMKSACGASLIARDSNGSVGG